MWWILLLSLSAAADDIDLEAVRILDEELPETRATESEEEVERRRYNQKYYHPYKKTSLQKILNSGTEYGHVKEGRYLIRLSDNKQVELTEPFYGKFYKLQDDQGFKYVESNDGTCVYKLKTEHFTSIQQELELYEPPLKYTPAPVNITRSDYDKKLRMLPEGAFYLGMVQGTYMKDLFNDDKAKSGITTQYGLHYATKWELPLKVGAVIHYEKTTYDLQGGGEVNYSAISFGPQFKSKDFDLDGYAVRLQTQFRVSPFARASAQTIYGDVDFKFNSADLMLSAEHPMTNRLGEFVLGLFFQSQWLNMKDQPEIVSIKASNETNKSFGLSLAQVFE